MSGKLPLWNPIGLVSPSAFQAFQGSPPPSSAIWLIQSCGSMYLHVFVPFAIILSLMFLVLAVGDTLKLPCPCDKIWKLNLGHVVNW